MGFEKIVRRTIELGAAGGILALFADWGSHFGQVGHMWSVQLVIGQDGIFGQDGLVGQLWHDPATIESLKQTATETIANLDPITDQDNPTFVGLKEALVRLDDPSLTPDQLRHLSQRVHSAEHLWEHRQDGHVLLANFAGGSQWISLDNPLFVHLKTDVSLKDLSPTASYELHRYYEHVRGGVPDLRVTEGSNLSIQHRSHLVHGTDIVRAIDLGFADQNDYTSPNIAKVLYDAQAMTPQAEVYYEVPKDTTSDEELKSIRDRIVTDLQRQGMSPSQAHAYVYGNGGPESGHVRRVDATAQHFHQDLLDLYGNPLPSR